jgi:phosphate transport system substrate-binding protein
LRSTMRRAAGLCAVLVTFGMVGTACGGDSSTKTTPSTGSGAAASSAAPKMDYSKLSGTLTADGSSFANTYYQKVITQFASSAAGLKVTYTASSSGQGRADLGNKLEDWIGTDAPPSASDPPFQGGPTLLFPTTAGAITVSYHVTGIDKEKLQLSPDTIAKIFEGQVTTWNDPVIKADNPDLTLPATPIAPVRRSDGSGTTQNFTKYLVAASPTVWTLGTDKDLGDKWPKGFLAEKGSAAEATTIATTEGAIGYVDLPDAVNNDALGFAKIKNSGGTYVDPIDAAGTEAAVAGAAVKDDLSFDPLNGKDAKAYPITGPTYILVYAKQADQAHVDNLKGWLNFVLTDGQNLASDLGYTKLPDSLAAKALTQLGKITT